MVADLRTPWQKAVGRLLVLVGLAALGVMGLGGVGLVTSPEVEGSRVTLPGTARFALSPGEHVLWLAGVGSTYRGGLCDADRALALLEQAGATLTGPAGPVRLEEQDDCDSSGPNGRHGISATTFTADRAGTYVLTGRAAPTPDAGLFVSPPDPSARAFALLFGGLAVAVAALLLKALRF